MTVTDEAVETTVNDETPDPAQTQTTENDGEKTEGAKRGRKRDLDFSKVTDFHCELAQFVNERSQLDPITPNQVKALITLRTDFAESPEQAAKREARKAQLAAEQAQYEGMSDEQRKAAKAAKRADEQAARFEKKRQEALDKAAKLRAEAEGSGQDLAAVVEAQQQEATQAPPPQQTAETVVEEADKPRRGLGRNRNR